MREIEKLGPHATVGHFINNKNKTFSSFSNNCAWEIYYKLLLYKILDVLFITELIKISLISKRYKFCYEFMKAKRKLRIQWTTFRLKTGLGNILGYLIQSRLSSFRVSSFYIRFWFIWARIDESLKYWNFWKQQF